jgi:demethylmenaquinone methyltransferase/2-methoxy-6-polyprenyl-1,4-benzoquinol methylase
MGNASPRRAPPPARIRAMFDDIVERYDLLNGLLSFGLDRRWRRAAARAIAAGPGDLILDVGTGTGDLARLVGRHGAGTVGVDLSHHMLTAALAKVDSTALLVQGSVFSLPFRDQSFTGAVSAFVLRNLDDLPAAFAELARVVRPGGRVALVDITEPAHPLLRRAFDGYLRLAAPRLGRLVGKGDAYRYLAGSLAQLPPPAYVCTLLDTAGFRDSWARPLTGGMVTLFTATRAASEGEGE